MPYQALAPKTADLWKTDPSPYHLCFGYRARSAGRSAG
jgi:hypothetical protein